MTESVEFVRCSDCDRRFVNQRSLEKHRNAPPKGIAPTESHDPDGGETCPTVRSKGGGAGE